MQEDPPQLLPSESPNPLFPQLARIAGWIGVAAVIFSLGFWPLRVSTDEWWHLKSGKYIVEHGLPKNDVFTYTAANYEWDNHEWLSQVGMYHIYAWGEERVIGGWRAVILVKSLILIAAYLLLGRFLAQRTGGTTSGALLAIFLTLLAVSVGRKTFWPRPPVISYLFLVFFLYVMWLHRSGRLRTPYLLILPLLMPLWANLHGGFLLGGIVVAAYCGGEFLEWLGMVLLKRFRKKETEAPDKETGAQSPTSPILSAKLFRAITYMVLGILCGLASLLTPYGYKLYLLSDRVMRSKELVSRLSELMPPNFRYTWAYGFLLALLGVGFFILIIRTLINRKTEWPPLADLLLVAFFFWQSINYVRHLTLFGLVATPLAAWMMARWLSASWSAGWRAKIIRSALIILSIAWGAWLIFMPGEVVGVIKHLREPQHWGLAPSSLDFNKKLFQGESVLPNEYPEQAVNFILSAKLPGQMYNRDNIAGYLIWRLSPEYYKVFTDSRFDIFGDDFLADELSVANGWPDGYLKPFGTPVRDWRKVIDAWKINWLFLESGEKINEILAQRNSGWALIYDDGAFLIWLKRTTANLPWIEKYEKRTMSEE